MKNGWRMEIKDGWIDKLNGVLNERYGVLQKKPGAPKGNKNAVNNRGGAKRVIKMLSVIPEDLLHCVMVMLLVMVYIESIYRKKYMI